MFVLGQKSLALLEGVHPHLVGVVKRAIRITKADFRVSEGLRTIERQKELIATGKSWTMNSRHITGHAVDLIPMETRLGQVRWDLCPKIAEAMFQAAEDLKVAIRWGGDWNENGKSEDERNYDGPHFELRRKEYP